MWICPFTNGRIQAVGSDAYADTDGSFGLTTLEKRHVRKVNGSLVFEFTGKSGARSSGRSARCSPSAEAPASGS